MVFAETGNTIPWDRPTYEHCHDKLRIEIMVVITVDMIGSKICAPNY